MHADELLEDRNHTAGSDSTVDVNREALAGPLVHYCQPLQRLPVRARIEDNVLGVINCRCGRRSRPTHPHTSAPLTPGHLELRLPFVFRETKPRQVAWVGRVGSVASRCNESRFRHAPLLF
jgi:hypothetical protein